MEGSGGRGLQRRNALEQRIKFKVRRTGLYSFLQGILQSSVRAGNSLTIIYLRVGFRDHKGLRLTSGIALLQRRWNRSSGHGSLLSFRLGHTKNSPELTSG